MTRWRPFLPPLIVLGLLCATPPARAGHPLDVEEARTLGHGTLELELVAIGPAGTEPTRGISTGLGLHAGLTSRWDLGVTVGLESAPEETAEPSVGVDAKLRIVARKACSIGLRGEWHAPWPGNAGQEIGATMLVSWDVGGRTVALNLGHQLTALASGQPESCWCGGAATLFPMGTAVSMAFELVVHRPAALSTNEMEPAVGVVWSVTENLSFSAGARTTAVAGRPAPWSFSVGITRVL